MRYYTSGVLCAILIATALPVYAGSYANTAFFYTVDLPEGWQTASPPTAATVQFTCSKLELSAKLVAAKKPAAVTEADAARHKQQDEEAITAKAMGHKPVAIKGPDVAGKPANHYGFVYKEKSGAVQVARFALFSRQRPDGHVWVKFQAVCPKAQFGAASKSIDQFLMAFRFKEEEKPAPQVYVPPSTTPAQPMSSNAQAIRNDLAPKPASTGSSSRFRKSYRAMTPDEVKTMKDSFASGIQERTAEEKARARQYGIGGIFTPTK